MMGMSEYGDGVGWFRGSMIGKGSYGCVYLATSKNSRSKYSYFPSVMAVKSAEVEVSGSIQKEREVLGNIKGCPHIIRCFGEETTMGGNGVMVYNLLLEYGSGGTLADRIKKFGVDGLPEIEAKVFARCILRGLHHVHGIGYVHCDLKPENVLLVPHKGLAEFRAKIGDFGLAKRANNQSKKRKLEPYWRGTPMYLSPEAVIDNVQECPSDIWALGCIVLQMLTGLPPWDDSKELSAEELLRKIGEGRESPIIPNGISKEAKKFLKGCFVRNSAYRLTAEMLLNHPFLEGLDAYDSVEEEVEVEDLNEIESILLVSESESEVSCDFSDDDSYYYLSELEEDDEEDEEEYEEDEVISSLSEERELKKEEIKDVVELSSIDAGLNRSKKKLRQIPPENTPCYPVAFTIPAGV